MRRPRIARACSRSPRSCSGSPSSLRVRPSAFLWIALEWRPPSVSSPWASAPSRSWPFGPSPPPTFLSSPASRSVGFLYGTSAGSRVLLDKASSRKRSENWRPSCGIVRAARVSPPDTRRLHASGMRRAATSGGVGEPFRSGRHGDERHSLHIRAVLGSQPLSGTRRRAFAPRGLPLRPTHGRRLLGGELRPPPRGLRRDMAQAALGPDRGGSLREGSAGRARPRRLVDSHPRSGSRLARAEPAHSSAAPGAVREGARAQPQAAAQRSRAPALRDRALARSLRLRRGDLRVLPRALLARVDQGAVSRGGPRGRLASARARAHLPEGRLADGSSLLAGARARLRGVDLPRRL